MTCDEFETHLNEILDERRRPEWDDRLRAHAGHCRVCRDLASAYAALFEGFFALSAPQSSADLSDRVMAALQDPVAPARPRSRMPLIVAAFSTAAAVLVAFLLTRSTQPEQQVAQAPAVSVKTDPTDVEAPAVAAQVADPAKQPERVKVDLARLERVPLVGAAFVSAGDNDPTTDPYKQLAKDAGQGLAQIVLVLPGVAGPSGVRPPAPASLNGSGLWPAKVTDELRPVTESMSETFNLLLDALPLTVWSNNKKTRAS